MSNRNLPFWSFFHDIEKALSYERWIDKYKLFLDALTFGQIIYDKDYNHFINFCKALYLQDHRDEDQFESILRQAIAREKAWLSTLLQEEATASQKPQENTSPIQETKTGSKTNEDEIAPEDKPITGNQEPDEIYEQQERGLPAESNTVYYHPSFTKIHRDNQSTSARLINYLLTDEYFPVSRRQMVKGWQFLRRQEKGVKQNDLDLRETIKQIAIEGMFLEPKYRFGIRNREDAIIIFADYRGSMIAFHELSNRLIETAKGEGGHPRAPVYYFQNYPSGYVYKKSNFTEPVKIKEALLKTNRNFTVAIVISDAGAARGNKDQQAIASRVTMTDFLLDHLNKTCAHTVWLNPMPAHRWKGTAAEIIREKVLLMAPIIEQGSYNFQDNMRNILKHHVKNEIN